MHPDILPPCGDGPSRVLGQTHMWKPHCSKESSPQFFFTISVGKPSASFLVVVSTPDSEGAWSMGLPETLSTK